ncbi:conjugal transfer protein TraF [Geobacter sp. DSM 9736]|uniref:conjugal transfer protein TraF n=1 Tax=Geobacter sp. DSM 9736 TaxID=1277350 RepID=UPI000B50BF46|nr:conjugal transfer protein TraF [Geobacter sp. DSM 9736]SNB47532.1 plasmid transfer operon, TraF, protein [Geobacter sp. DSM 9736]
MRNRIILNSLLLLLTAAPCSALEFQPVGSLGIGGAGVARTTNAYAGYWNPAGLAFSETAFSSRLNIGAGVRINSTMAENVDKIGKLDIEELDDININASGLTPALITQNREFAGKAVQFVGILDNLSKEDGNLTVNADAILAFQYRRFAIGGFSTAELAAVPRTETTAIRFGGTTTMNDFALGIGSLNAVRGGTQLLGDYYGQVVTAFGGGQQAEEIVSTLEAELVRSNPTSMTSEQARDALILMGNALRNQAPSLEDNQSKLEYTGIILIDFPISYGHQIDLGSFGKLGVGGSLKVIQARTFIGESQIVKLEDSGDIVEEITDHYKDSTGFGVDLGALWRYGDWLSVGIVGKNLNSPSFDTPVIAGIATRSIKVKPQVRTGVAVEPFSWLTLAADLDLTENDTILVGRKSRNFGGGLELHPFTWLKFRAGAYENLADGDVGIVGTAGLTIGTKWLSLDIDGAASPETGKFEDSKYPKEARIQTSLNIQF